LLITGEPPKQAEDRERPNPNACTGLAEHLLPRRHGLIQSFPRSHAFRELGFHRRTSRTNCRQLGSDQIARL